MTSIINPKQAKRLLEETIKGSPRIQNPKLMVEHAEFIADLVDAAIKSVKRNMYFGNNGKEVDEEEMKSAALLHDIGYCFAEDQYLHPVVGGEYLRRRGYPRIAKIIETHTYAPEAVLLIGYKGCNDPRPWLPTMWNQVMIDFASLHAGKPGEIITADEKFQRFKRGRDERFQEIIEYAESRLHRGIGEVEQLLGGNETALSAYEVL